MVDAPPRRIIVLGAGAIGASVGALLHRSGQDVTLVARGAHGRAMAHGGVDLRTPHGAERIPVPVVSHVSEVRPEPSDLVLLTVMGQHTSEALAELSPDVPIASMQNGSRPLDIIADRGHPLLATVVFVPAVRRDPGVIALHGSPAPGGFLLGPWRGRPAPHASWLASRLEAAGFVAHVEDDLGPWVRAKVLGNLAGIAVALCDAPPQDLLQLARDEACAVWRAQGVQAQTVQALAARTGHIHLAPVDGRDRIGGSTRHALSRGKPLETPVLHDPIVDGGRRLGVPTPVNRALVDLSRRAAAEGWEPGALSPEGLRREVLALTAPRGR